MSQNWYFGGGIGSTTLLPIVGILMILTIILMLRLPRKYVIIPFLLSTFLIPREEQVVIGGVHLFVTRIILILAWVRLAMLKVSSARDLFQGRLGLFDKVFTVWALYRAFAYMSVFHYESGVIINQAGSLLDVLGAYFLLRYLIRDDRDILLVLKCFAVVVIIAGPCMAYEKFRGVNPFGYLGGPFQPEVRDGAIRAQGPFAHSILAGTFGATLVPLFIWLWKSGQAKALACVAILCSTIMSATSASSTPLMAYGACILAICFWPMRRQMRPLRWALVILLIVLHLVMKAPVWFLIARVDLTGASSGYHRAELVDHFIRHFRDWWLIGTNSTGTYDEHLWDQSNQFVAEGQTGGLVTFVCFIAMISMCFSKVGTARKRAKSLKQEWYFWLFGCALLGHIIGFFGISYFDHVQVAWFALFAMINAAVVNRPPATVLGSEALRKHLTVTTQGTSYETLDRHSVLE